MNLSSVGQVCIDTSRFASRSLTLINVGTLIFQGCARRVTFLTLLSSASLITLAKVSSIALLAILAFRLLGATLLYATGKLDIDATAEQIAFTALEGLILVVVNLSLFRMGGGFTPPRPPPSYSFKVSPWDDG